MRLWPAPMRPRPLKPRKVLFPKRENFENERSYLHAKMAWHMAETEWYSWWTDLGLRWMFILLGVNVLLYTLIQVLRLVAAASK